MKLPSGLIGSIIIYKPVFNYVQDDTTVVHDLASLRIYHKWLHSKNIIDLMNRAEVN